MAPWVRRVNNTGKSKCSGHGAVTIAILNPGSKWGVPLLCYSRGRQRGFRCKGAILGRVMSQEQNVIQTSDDPRGAVVRFIESLRSNKGFEPIKARIRVVPRGLFIEERVIDQVITEFQTWLTKASAGAAQKTFEKTKQWLFEDGEPERFYVVEGKTTLTGYIIAAQVGAPQRFGLPYYLGSLLPSSTYLHPSDPELARCKGLEVRSSGSGVEAVVQKRDKRLILSEQTIKSFEELAKGSPFLQRRYPGSEKNLSVCVRALAGLVRRARAVPRGFPMLVPFDVKTMKHREVRVAGKFLFVEERGKITRIIEAHGRNLSSFLRSELSRVPREKLGSFRLTPKHRDLVGFYERAGKRTSVHARAFAEFSELIRRARDPREKFAGWFTAAECFEKFSSFFQLSQPIERHKVASSIERFDLQGAEYRAYGGWIFTLSREKTIMRVVARHVRMPGQRRKKAS